MADNLPFEIIEREIIVKAEAHSDPALGEDIESRPISQLIECSIVNVDKPRGPTSYQVSERVRQILNVKKSGHSGTLDSAVTGVLPVALGRATRIVQVLLPAGKEYLCRMHLHKEVSQQQLREVFQDFIGIISQIPPVKSAVKRQSRERKIYYMDILQLHGRDVRFKVGCQAGTYIRKLVHDMGLKMGPGAHMTELRRTKVGCFDEASLCTLHQLEDAYSSWKKHGDERLIRKVIQPIENAVRHLPKIWVDDGAVEPLCHGTDLAVPGISKLHDKIKPGDTVAVMTLKNELIAIGKSKLTSTEMYTQKKGIAVNINKVFMREGTYIKI
jgi:H/ACA ribonucleoprotein complex subunit 4